ncbi:hypothetical protein OIV83_004075 [Microbotryomycetes sp. JL201]|nr:hypothetical protein OIV83_004075 [Microbotryomycetes sp. JL201]
MPLVDGRLVPVLKGPADVNVPPCVRVHRIDATGETFFHEAPYMHRLHYLRQPIFECQATGRTGLDYFAALESETRAAEQQRARQAHEMFPDELKARVLGTAQFRKFWSPRSHRVRQPADYSSTEIESTLDGLCDDVYERYENRFFVGEKVFVDLGGDKYFSRIAKVFPPREVRALARPDAYPAPMLPGSGTVVFDEFARVSHAWGINLGVDIVDVQRHDPAEDYLYTVQLMLGEGKFEGSFMELKASKLSRDRAVFTQAILKRYLRDSLQRSAAPSAPWLVKPDLARAYRIPMLQTHADRARIVKAAESRQVKRKIPPPSPPEGGRRLSDVKRPRLDPAVVARESSAPQHSAFRSAHATQRRESATRGTPMSTTPPLKYPIEDLDIVRSQTSSQSAVRGPISRPSPDRSLPVSRDIFSRFVCVWANISIFSKCLGVSLFTMDDFANALKHTATDPPCQLLIEVHASLTNIIGSDSSRVFGTTGAPSVQELQRVEATGELEVDELEQDDEGANGHIVNGFNGHNSASAEHELNVLLRKGISYSRRWEKTAKLKAADGRKGWMRHVVGALCQRGGPRVMPNLRRILEHLFQAIPETVGQSTAPQRSSQTRRGSTPSAKHEDELVDSDVDIDSESGENCDPASAYYTLSVLDKVDILHFLCSLMLGSKAARQFIDEGEARLTDLRKARADWKKQQKTGASKKIERGAISGADGGPLDHVTEVASSATPSPVKEGEKSARERRSSTSVFVLPPPGNRDQNASVMDIARTSEEAYSAWLKREMRRWHGVARCRPLGQDRFMCKYWWFDGLGSMSLISADDNVVIGERLDEEALGPSRQEFKRIKAHLGDAAKEAVHVSDRDLVVGVDDWAFFDNDQQLARLIDWLDPRGIREKELKAALVEHKSELLATFQQRHEQQEALQSVPAGTGTAARRSTRNKDEAANVHAKPYYATN